MHAKLKEKILEIRYALKLLKGIYVIFPFIFEYLFVGFFF